MTVKYDAFKGDLCAGELVADYAVAMFEHLACDLRGKIKVRV
jgi:hypothetical protein